MENPRVPPKKPRKPPPQEIGGFDKALYLFGDDGG